MNIIFAKIKLAFITDTSLRSARYANILLRTMEPIMTSILRMERPAITSRIRHLQRKIQNKTRLFRDKDTLIIPIFLLFSHLKSFQSAIYSKNRCRRGKLRPKTRGTTVADGSSTGWRTDVQTRRRRPFGRRPDRIGESLPDRNSVIAPSGRTKTGPRTVRTEMASDRRITPPQR